MQQSNEFMADLWGTFCHQLPNTKLPTDCVGTIPQQTVGMLWVPSALTVEEIQRICLWPQNLWGHAGVLHERQEANSSETVGNLLFFLFCLFSFGTTHGKKADREFWKVFSSALPPLPQKYRAKLLLILKGTETNAEHFLIVAEEVFSVFRNVNVQFNRILNNSFLKFTLCCYKRVFCLRLKQCFYAKGARLVLPTGCEFIAKAHTMFVTIFFAGSASLLLSIASITRSQTVFKQHFSTCNLWSICEPRNIWK